MAKWKIRWPQNTVFRSLLKISSHARAASENRKPIERGSWGVRTRRRRRQKKTRGREEKKKEEKGAENRRSRARVTQAGGVVGMLRPGRLLLLGYRSPGRPTNQPRPRAVELTPETSISTRFSNAGLSLGALPPLISSISNSFGWACSNCTPRVTDAIPK